MTALDIASGMKTYTVRIEGKPEPVEVAAHGVGGAAEAAVELYDFDMDGKLSEGDGSFVTVTVVNETGEETPFRVSCSTSPVYRLAA